jgi:hypothetical protein
MDRMIRNEANNLDDNVISVCFFRIFQNILELIV